MSDNYKHQSPGGCGQFSAQPEFNYSIENRPQLNFDGYQGQSHGFIQKDFLSYTLNPNSVPCNTQRADYPSQNTHDFQLSVQTRPLYQQQFPQIKLPNRERSCTLPGSKNTQPTVFEGYCKASWNRPQVYDSGVVGIPSSEGDPYAGVRKWNELNSQRFLHKNSNNPPPPKIPSTDEKSILFGPRYARARMLEAHQKTSPPTLQHPPNPRHLLSSSHNRSQRFLEGEGKAERRFRGQCDSVHMMGGLAASESARIRIFDPTVSNSTPSGPRSRVSAESPISRVGSSGSGTSDEYMGFIIPSDPYTFHSVKKSNRMFQNSGADHTKAEATAHSSMAEKDQSIAPIFQQPALGVNSSNSKTGSLLGPAQKPMGRGGDGDSGANDEYMGFIIPSDPYTFYPVQESSKKLQNSGADPAKTEATGHSGMVVKDQSIAPICQQPAPGVNTPNSETGSLLGPAQNPMGRDGDGDSGANDEYMGFIIPSDPYTFYPVQESSKKLQNSGADPTKTDVTDHSGMAVKDQVIAPIFQQPVPKVNSSNSKPGSLLGPAQDPMGRDGGGNSSVNDEYMGFIIPSDPYTFHPVQESSKKLQNSGADPAKTEATGHSGMAVNYQSIAPICQQPAPGVNTLNSETGSLLGPAQNPMGRDGDGDSGASDEYMGFIIPSDPYTFHPVQESSKRVRNSEADPTKTEATDHSGMTMKDQVIALICQQPGPKVNKSNSKTGSLLGPAENPTGGDGGGNSGANDEYIGFIIPSDPHTLHAVQNSNTKFWKLGTDHGRVRIAEDGGKAQFRITAPVQQPALKVNSPNLKTATQQADAREDQVHSLPSRKIV